MSILRITNKTRNHSADKANALIYNRFIHNLKFMPMNDLLQTRIFGLLSETSQEVTNEEMQNAYGDFVKQIESMSSENDYSITYRILTATRIEIASLETIPLYGQGGKCA